VFVCLSVCLSVRTKSAETNSPILTKTRYACFLQQWIDPNKNSVTTCKFVFFIVLPKTSAIKALHSPRYNGGSPSRGQRAPSVAQCWPREWARHGHSGHHPSYALGQRMAEAKWHWFGLVCDHRRFLEINDFRISNSDKPIQASATKSQPCVRILFV
jgi:hypothetical protein